MTERMSKGEREDLVRLIKQRERVFKSAAEQRASELNADFEKKLSAIYSYDDDSIWKKAYDAAEAATQKAVDEIKARCMELGIPERFAPTVNMYWTGRGENAAKQRREELRKAAKAEIEALEKRARVKIELDSVNAQTQVIAHGMTSEAAKDFLENMPAMESIMPAIELKSIEHKAESSAGRRDDQWA